DAQTGKTSGTTRNGIGPCYADKAYRMDGDRLLNIKLGDLNDDPKKYFAIIKENLMAAAKMYGLSMKEIGDSDDLIKKLEAGFRKIKKHIESDTLYLEKKAQSGARILFEGAQSIMLDITKGSVPYVTSSNTVAAAAYVGGDLSPSYHRKTIGIAKAIMSRVGHGPFASEFGGKRSEDYCMTAVNGKPKYSQTVEIDYGVEKLLKSKEDFDIGVALRILSREYGTVTTRPRRVGILDLVQLSYAIRMNGVNELVINKCDVLNVFASTKKAKIPLVVGYKLDGKNIDYVPGSVISYYKVKPVVEYLNSFRGTVSHIKDFKALPGALREFVLTVERKCGCKITGIGVGPERDQFVKIN
ncbi:MAG: adenylosuccinate synthetase, partial [Patescibacteria group bacterium]